MTVASEVMAILALTTDLRDMRERLGIFIFIFLIDLKYSNMTQVYFKYTKDRQIAIYRFDSGPK